MKAFKIALATAVMTAMAGTAQAQDNYYNLGAEVINVEAGSTDLSFLAAVGRVGKNINEYVSIEGQFIFGVNDDQGDAIEHGVSAYGKLRYPLGEQFDVFGRVGFHNTTISSGIFSLNDRGLAYGAGGEYDFGTGNALRFEYTAYELDNTLSETADAFSVAYVRKF